MKKVFLGLLVAGVALAGSAFTNVNNKAVLGPYLAQTSSGTWVKITPTTEPSGDKCLGVATLQCYYQITGSIPTQSTYSTTDINNFLASPAKIASGVNSKPALYVP